MSLLVISASQYPGPIFSRFCFTFAFISIWLRSAWREPFLKARLLHCLESSRMYALLLSELEILCGLMWHQDILDLPLSLFKKCFQRWVIHPVILNGTWSSSTSILMQPTPMRGLRTKLFPLRWFFFPEWVNELNSHLLSSLSPSFSRRIFFGFVQNLFTRWIPSSICCSSPFSPNLVFPTHD